MSAVWESGYRPLLDTYAKHSHSTEETHSMKTINVNKLSLRTSLVKAIQWCVLAVLAGVASQASALPSQSVDVYYYSDDTFTHQVGSEVMLTCSGAPKPRVLHGQMSAYEMYVQEACRQPRSMEINCMVDGMATFCPQNICSVLGLC